VRAWVLLYLAALAGSVLVFNADAENAWPALGLAGGASIVLGWATERPSLAVLALLAVPFSIPFGYADDYLGSDAPYVWWFGVFVALVSALAILGATWVKRVIGARATPRR
jgi:hypothetical protein